VRFLNHHRVRQPGGNVTGIAFSSEEGWEPRRSVCCATFCRATRRSDCWSIPTIQRRSADAVAAARALGLTMEVVRRNPSRH
jgi:hypothetical protein